MRIGLLSAYDAGKQEWLQLKKDNIRDDIVCKSVQGM
jgi:hypothetical protein